MSTKDKRLTPSDDKHGAKPTRSPASTAVKKCKAYTYVAGKSVRHTLPRVLSRPPSSYRSAACPYCCSSEAEDPLQPVHSTAAVVPARCRRVINEPGMKPLLRDKLLWFVHSIARTGALGDEGAPVNFQFYMRFIGMRDKHLINLLTELRLIEKCAGPMIHVSAARYRFTAEIRRCPKLVKEDLKVPRMIKKRLDKSNLPKARLYGASRSAKLYDDLGRIRPGDEFLNRFVRYIAELESKGKQTSSMEALYQFWKAGEVRLSIKSDRISTHISSTPSSLRSQLLVGNSRAVEIDLPNSHPAMLASLFSPSASSSTSEQEQHRKLVRLISIGLLYEAFEHCWQKDRKLFLPYAVKKGRSKRSAYSEERRKFLNLPPRKGIKICFQVLFNSHNTFEKSSIIREMRSSLPAFTNRFIAYKKKAREDGDKSRLGNQLRALEADYVNTVAEEVDQPIATIYDGWLSNDLGYGQVMQVAPKVSKRILGFEHLPLKKGDPSPEHPGRKIGRQAAADNMEAPF